MKKLDSRYIVGVFLLLFVLRGILEFIWKGNHSFTLDEIYFRVPIVVGVVIGLIPIHKGWGTFKSLFFIF